ncbi:MAG: hypothetical protein J6M53_04695 [Bacteroidaceae bacterium]|nr:hypothetical protein [Bacteroidaceae bacterium]
MKKNFRLFAIAFATLLIPTLASCGDDDNDGEKGYEGGSDLSSLAPTITDLNGNTLRIASIGSYTFDYDERGVIKGCRYSDSEKISFEGNKIVYTTDWDEYGTYTLALANGNLVTALNYIGEDRDEDSPEKYQGHLSFTYDGDNQCTGFSGTYVETYGPNRSGERGTHNYNIKQTNTWEDGNLVRCVLEVEEKESGVEDGKSISGHYKYRQTFEFQYGTRANPLRQMPDYIADRIGRVDDEFVAFTSCGDDLALLGLLGKGPARLPISETHFVEVTDVKTGESYSYNSSIGRSSSINIVLNSNGTISTENGTKYTYVSE